jgi:P27 family predicted phage terminase small subunit
MKGFPKIPKMPADLDREAKKKWRELAPALDPDCDLELLGMYCRQWSSLLSIRAEKAKQQREGVFETMVAGRDGTKQLNPLLTTENRLVASLNRMLATLGLTPGRELGTSRKLQPNPPPPGMSGPEPPWGWAIEQKLYGPDEDFQPGGKHWKPKTQ